MDYNLIATPLVGAVIGYLTNWLAIKMLFRPHHPKRIFGVKLPFTPGLIPKERERIAHAIGEVIQDYLLTDEVILKELTSDTMDEAILSFFEENDMIRNDQINLYRLFDRSHTLEEFIPKILDPLTKEALAKLELELPYFLTSFLKDTSLQKLSTDHAELFEQVLDAFFHSENPFLYQLLTEGLDLNKTVEEYLSKDIISKIQEIIQQNEPLIKENILKVLANDDFSSQAKAMISKVISSKFGAIGTMFVNANSIYESIVVAVDEKLEETQVSTYLNQYIEEMFKGQLKEYLTQENKEDLIAILYRRILNKDIKNMLLEALSKSDRSLYEYIQLFFTEGDEAFIGHLSQGIMDLLQKYLYPLALKFAIDFIRQPIKIASSTKEKIKNGILSLYHSFAKKYLIRWVKVANLSSIIERQINEFEVQVLEEIILSISKKELRAITWLGGFLGMIISIILLIF